jgi:hypothetical protein
MGTAQKMMGFIYLVGALSPWIKLVLLLSAIPLPMGVVCTHCTAINLKIPVKKCYSSWPSVMVIFDWLLNTTITVM